MGSLAKAPGPYLNEFIPVYVLKGPVFDFCMQRTKVSPYDVTNTMSNIYDNQVMYHSCAVALWSTAKPPRLVTPILLC